MTLTPKATLKEMMVIEASKFISNGDTVMVGTGMPFVASIFALKSHAPEMCFVVETGTIAPEVIPIPISVSMSYYFQPIDGKSGIQFEFE